MDQAQQQKYKPLGVLDSGVGGLSVVKDIQRHLPHEDILYLADSANCPYGLRSPDEIRKLTWRVATFLRTHEAKALVIACNTASTAAVAYLRELWPGYPIIGMVPAVKPAAAMTSSGVIGVLATKATGRTPVLLDVIDRFAGDARVIITAPPGLVEAVEAGQENSPVTAAILAEAVGPLMQAGADALVLGCTHFPFLRPALEKIVRGRMQLIDSGDAVARQTVRVLAAFGLLNTSPSPGKMTCFTSGEPAHARQVIAHLLGIEPDSLSLEAVNLNLTDTR